MQGIETHVDARTRLSAMRDALDALRDLHAILPPLAGVEALLNVAEWAVDLQRRETFTPIGALAADVVERTAAAVDRQQQEEAPTAAAAAATATVTAAPASDDWSDEDIVQLITLRDRGFTASGIAAELGRSLASVRAQMREIEQDEREDAPSPLPPAAKAAAKPVAKVVTQKATPAPVRRPATMSARERAVEAVRAHVDGLPADARFDPTVDLTLFTASATGIDLGDLGDSLNLPVTALQRRCKIMVPEGLRAKNGAITLNGREIMIAALKARAADHAGKDAAA